MIGEFFFWFNIAWKGKNLFFKFITTESWRGREPGEPVSSADDWNKWLRLVERAIWTHRPPDTTWPTRPTQTLKLIRFILARRGLGRPARGQVRDHPVRYGDEETSWRPLSVARNKSRIRLREDLRSYWPIIRCRRSIFNKTVAAQRRPPCSTLRCTEPRFGQRWRYR